MDKNTINKIFELQVKNSKIIRQTTYKDRIKKIKSIIQWMYNNRTAVKDALRKDFSKPSVEVDITEMWVAINFANDIIKNLKRWMSPKKVPSSLAVLFSKSYIEYYPKGVCLIIAPWNYPFQLCVVPLMYSIAAGNCCIIKPSESTPYTSKLVSDMIKDLFNEGEIAVIEGDAKEAKLLLDKPFNHIFFTGSDSIGKKVVEASSKYLSSFTLELGGKSPVIIDRKYQLSNIIDKVITTKFINLGQSCIAPDYIAIHENDFDAFVKLLIQRIKSIYGDSFKDQKKSKSLARIVNDNHFDRLINMIDDKNCKILYGGGYDKKERFISPTIVDMRDHKTEISNQEIFGPIIPIVSYSTDEDLNCILEEAGNPLALYIFSNRKIFINRVKELTSSGAVCINDIAVHFLNQNLPFGGVMSSGAGRYHGFSGFKEFSNSRSTIVQSKINFLSMIGPPYSKTTQKIVDTLIYLYKKI
tara:strand:+ start:75 stop:1484 length:1410 start_codon:yes stop_codon:yes gene_type:complete